MIDVVVLFFVCLFWIGNCENIHYPQILGYENVTMADFNGKCSNVKDSALNKKFGYCESWDINVIVAFDKLTSDQTITEVENALAMITKNCTSSCTLQLYVPGMSEADKCSKCEFGKCVDRLKSLPTRPDLGMVEVGKDAAVLLQLFYSVFECIEATPLEEGRGGLIYFITTTKCQHVPTMLKSIIDNQQMIVNRSVANGYLLRFVNLQDEDPCFNKGFFDFCEEKALLYVVTSLLPYVNNLEACPNFPIHSRTALKISVSVCGSVVVCILITAYVVYRFRKKLRTLKAVLYLNSFIARHTIESTNYPDVPSYQNKYSNLPKRKLKDEYEISDDELIMENDNIIGKGAFAVVYKGVLTSSCIERLLSRQGVSAKARFQLAENDRLEVAVKVLRPYANSSSISDFFTEIDFQKGLKHHPHVLSLIAYVSASQTPKIITEFCSRGNLLKFLRDHHSIVTTNKAKEAEIELKQLYSFAWQISDGMNYLNSLGVIHRDLAARNILLTSNLTAKISDFGLCRRIDEAMYTAKGGKLPIPWMAIESLKHYEFNITTDVWSYGVLLYELFSLGDCPYQGLQLTEILEFLEAGNRLKAPKSCPSNIYLMMLSCWAEEAYKRPSFQSIQDLFSKLLDKNDETYGYLSCVDDHSNL